jgi:hypothetical protein
MRLKADPGHYLGICLLVGLLSSLPFLSLFAGLFGVVFYAGVIGALHLRAQGGTPRLSQAFDGFSRPGALARLIPIVLLNIAMAVVAIIAIVIALGPALLEVIRQGGQTAPDPAMLLALMPRFALAFLVLLPLGVMVGWITLLAVPRAMLDDVPGGRAIREAIEVIAANFGALLVNLLCLLALMLVLVVLLMIPMSLIGALSANRPFLGQLVQIPLMTAFTASVYAIYSSIMYQAWRDIHGGVAETAAAAGSIEA